MPFNALPSWSGRIVLLASMGLKQSDTVLSTVSPTGQCRDSRTKHIFSLYMQRSIYLYWSFSLKRMTQNYHSQRGCKCALRECRPVDATFAFSLSLATACQYLPQERILSSSPDFATVTKGTHPDCLVWMEYSMICECHPNGLYISLIN